MVKELSGKFAFDDRVLRSLGDVPRHLFVEAGLEHLSYEDRPLPIAGGQTVSQPFMVAMQTHLGCINRGDKVLEIGTGCGYQTAVLAGLGAKVYSVERRKELYISAQRNLARIECYSPLLFFGDGYEGLVQFAPFRAIIVTCGAPGVPGELLLQLEIGGRMVIPLGGQDQAQELSVIIRKSESEFDRTAHGKCCFVPMLGGICK